jgi:hypothetical protein
VPGAVTRDRALRRSVPFLRTSPPVPVRSLQESRPGVRKDRDHPVCRVRIFRRISRKARAPQIAVLRLNYAAEVWRVMVGMSRIA